METFTNVTLVFLGVFGSTTIECKTVNVEVKPYAQHAEATHVTFVEKGKRKARGFVKTGEQSLVVLAGFGHGKFDCFEPTGPGSKTTRFSSFSDEWKPQHDAFIASLVERRAASSWPIVGPSRKRRRDP